MKKLIFASIVAVGAFGLIGSAQPVWADVSCPAGSQNTSAPSLAECSIPQDTNKTDINATISTVINVVIGIVGLLAVIVMILGGITFITSQGEAAKVTKAKTTILYGLVGLVVAMLAFAIVNLVLGVLSGPKQSDDDEGGDEGSYVQTLDEINRIA